MHEMSRAEKIANLLAVVIPFAATIAAIALLWNQVVDWTDLAILVGMYLITAFGITIGYHRLLTHRAFDTPPADALRARDHGLDGRPGLGDRLGRRPPQAPRLLRRGGRPALAARPRRRRRRRAQGPVARPRRLADRRPWPRRLEPLRARPDGGPRACGGSTARSRPWSASACCSRSPPDWSSPARIAGALTGLLWGGLVRVFFVHHVTWSINSVCHFMGTRRFVTDDESRNVFWLSVLSLGESWHHNHHAFPRSAHHGLRWWEVDISGHRDRRRSSGSASPATSSGSARSARSSAAPPASARRSWRRTSRAGGAGSVVERLRQLDEVVERRGVGQRVAARRLAPRGCR